VLKTREVPESSLLNAKFSNLHIFCRKAFFVVLVTNFVGLGFCQVGSSVRLCLSIVSNGEHGHGIPKITRKLSEIGEERGWI
jgi:hypothetical protein